MTYIPTVDEKAQPVVRISWSRLLDYELCHQKGFRKSQRQQAPIRDVRTFIHGTLADRAMRKWLDQETEQLPGQMAQYVDELWEQYTNSKTEKVKWRGNVKDDQKRVRDLAKLTVNNSEPFLFENVLPYEYQPDYSFQIPIKLPGLDNAPRTVVLNGAMDIAVRNPETQDVFIYDLKSTTNENYVSGKILAQLVFYCIAWHYDFPETDYSQIHTGFLTPATRIQYHPVVITDDDRRALKSRIVSLAHSWWQKDFTPRKDETYCGYCECRQWCEKFQVSRTTKNRVSLSRTAAKRAGVKNDSRADVAADKSTTSTDSAAPENG